MRAFLKFKMSCLASRQFSRQWIKAAGGCFMTVQPMLPRTDQTKRKATARKMMANEHMWGSVTSSWCLYTGAGKGTKLFHPSWSLHLANAVDSGTFCCQFCLTCQFPKRGRRICPATGNKAQLCHAGGTFSLHAQEEETSCLLLPASAPHCPWHKLHFSWDSLTPTENFRTCNRNGLCWFLSFHFSKIHAQNCFLLDPRSQSERDDFHACTAWGNACIVKIQAPGSRLSKACPRSEMH